MPMNNTSLMPSVGADEVQPLDYATLPLDVAEQLQRYEDDARRYLGDAQRSILQLAATLKAGSDLLAKRHVGTFDTWVQRLYPMLARATAYRLVSIANNLGPDYVSGGDVIPATLTSIGAIAAYLTAPEPVQEKVREGEIPPRRDEIAEATIIAQKAQKRAQELEAALTKANAELRELEGVRGSAQKTLELALKEAENSNLKVKILQDEMEKRIAAATASERAAIEKRYQSEIQKAQTEIEKTRGEVDKIRQQANRDLKSANDALREARQTAMDLADQLKRAGDEGAIWARWEIAAVRFGKQVDAIAAELPPESEMAVWLDGHWELHADLRKRVAALLNRLDQQEQRHAGHGYVVDAG